MQSSIHYVVHDINACTSTVVQACINYVHVPINKQLHIYCIQFDTFVYDLIG